MTQPDRGSSNGGANMLRGAGEDTDDFCDCQSGVAMDRDRGRHKVPRNFSAANSMNAVTARGV